MTVGVLILALAFALAGVILQIEFSLYVSYLLVGAYGLARLWTWHALRTVAFHRSYYDHAFLNQKVPIQVEIRNRGLIPLPWLRVEETIPIELGPPHTLRTALTLGPRERVRLSYEIAGARRGLFAIGPAILRSGDLFGFENPRETRTEVGQLTVYPLILPLSDLHLPSRFPFGTLRSDQKMFEDPSRVAGVRDYQRGDSLRHINWKVSARQGRLQARTYEPAISLHTVVLLNLNLEEYARVYRLDATERAIVVAASVAHHLAQERQDVGLLSNGRDALAPEGSTVRVPAGPGRGHLMRVLEALARIKAARAPAFEAFLRQEAARLPWGSALVVITGVAGPALLGEMQALRRKGYTAALICVEPHMGFPATRRQALALGIPAYQVPALPGRPLHLAPDQVQARRD